MKTWSRRRGALFLIILLVSLTVAEYIVPARPAYAAVVLSKTELSIKPGGTYQLFIAGTSNIIKWKSSNKKIATVSSYGEIKAKKRGYAIISAKAGKKKLKCKVHVLCKEHSYEKDSTVAATKENPGYTKYTCSVCRSAHKDIAYYQPTEEQAYNDIMAMKQEYPEGMSWTNDNYYEWDADIYSGGYGCMGFAFAMSDAAFGKYPPASKHCDLDNLKVGDIIRINHDTHSVVVIGTDGDTITITEGNYNKSIHWGRTLSKSKLKNDEKLYILTRYQQTSV